MQGIIWYVDREKGKKKLDEVVSDYLFGNVPPTSLKKYLFTKIIGEVIFENGDRWLLVPCTENSRGHRGNVFFVDENVPLHIMNEVIRPALRDQPFGYIKTYK